MKELENGIGSTTNLELGLINSAFEGHTRESRFDCGENEVPKKSQGNQEEADDAGYAHGVTNRSFEGHHQSRSGSVENGNIGDSQKNECEKGDEIPKWNNSLEFLMSCIAMSVGLGNIWRFPFVAYENGRGAFLVAYIIVVTLVGRPLYYLELSLGQFSSKGCVDVWACVPLLRGIGYSQILASSASLTYYCAIMAITLFYFFASFSPTLPWAICKENWEGCFDSTMDINGSHINRTGLISSSEFYFKHEVIHEKTSIEDGIGVPDWKLACCLLISWATIFLISIRGVKSSGKASYFLALFPYVVLLCLMIRGCTLPGALNGISFFVMPEWKELLNPKVWYAATTQAFFSLGTSFGALITYSSFNDFKHNIQRDALIVSVLDTFTSLIAGVTLFAILGNLAHNVGTTDITEVTKGGVGLAFVSYPEATSKFDIVPQFFSVMFFLMLYILGAGTAISLVSMILKVFMDSFPGVPNWKVTLASSLLLFLVGLIYVTPGGQHLIALVDFYASSLSIFEIACVEIIGVCWIYGFKNFCKDLQFMLERSVGLYWKVSWGFITPLVIIVIDLYSTILTSDAPSDYNYPYSAVVVGWILFVLVVGQIPLWAAYEIYRKEGSLKQRFVSSLRPSSAWGPYQPNIKKEWEMWKNPNLDTCRL